MNRTKLLKKISFFLLASMILLPASSSLFAQNNTIGVTDITWDVTEGFTIFSAYKGTYIINNCGQLIKQWESEFPISNSAYLLDNGDLLRTGSTGGNSYLGGGLIEKFNWEGELIWSYELDNDDYRQHHDIEPLPNGNVLAICYNFKEPIDAWNAGAMDSIEYWSSSVFEIEPLDNNQANIVWEWHLWDHLFQTIDSTRQNYQSSNHLELFDINEMYFPVDSVTPTFYVDVGPNWMHMNSIDYNAERDEIILSSRDHNEILIIDHSTTSEEAATHTGGQHNMGGDLIYRFGREEFYGQHDAHWINRPDFDENAILVFNNGFRHDEQFRSYSSVDMFIPKIDANGKYQHNEVDTFQVLLNLDNPNSIYSEIMGSAQILDDNRILICDSDKKNFYEFDTDRNIKWNYVSPLAPFGANSQGNPPTSPLIFRAKKLPLDHPAFENDWSVGDPIELNFDIDACLDITPISSSSFDPNIKFFPNPTDQLLSVETSQIIEEVFLYDSYGRAFFPTKLSENKWDVKNIPNGFYIVVLSDKSGSRYNDKIIIQH